MATVDTSYVRRELSAIAGSSNAVRKALYDALEQLEDDPAAFEPLDRVHPQIQRNYPAVTLRRVKIESGRHSFRLVFAHWEIEDAEDHVDVLYAFRRKAGYPIDWDWVDSVLEG